MIFKHAAQIYEPGESQKWNTDWSIYESSSFESSVFKQV